MNNEVLHSTLQDFGTDELDLNEDDPFAFFDNLEAIKDLDEVDGEANLADQEQIDQGFIDPDQVNVIQTIDEFIVKVRSKGEQLTILVGAAGRTIGSLSSLLSSCGVICAHSLGSLAQVANPGLSSLPALGNLSSPGFSVDANGNFRLDGNIDSLSRATGISKGDLLSGKFTAENILVSFFNVFGDSISIIFGFGLVSTIIDGIFDNFMPAAQAA